MLTFRQSVFQWINRISLRNYRFSMFIGHILVKMMWPPKITQWQRNINWTLYINCERNVYIYILHTLFALPKIWGLLISSCVWHLKHPSSSSNNSQKAFLHNSVPGTSFPKQKCLGEYIPRVRHWRHQDCQGRNPGGSPRNVSWGTYYTPYFGMTVTVHPQFHGSWGFTIS